MMGGMAVTDNRNSILKRLNIPGLIGSKLVYKRPPMRSAEGHRFMVKIYVGGLHKASVAIIQSALEDAINSPFKPKV
jgi:hypothetical protein